jgi:hypothetical protein
MATTMKNVDGTKALYFEREDKGRLIEAYFVCPICTTRIHHDDVFCRMCGEMMRKERI